MPVHRQTLIAHHELEETERRLADAVEEIKVDILEQDVEATLARIEELRRRADELEQTLLQVRR